MAKNTSKKRTGPTSRRPPPEEKQAYAVAFGKMVEFMREQRGLSRKDLAEEMGVSAATISRIEAGRSMPNGMLFSRLIEDLGIPPEKASAAVSSSVDWKKTAAGVGIAAATLLGPAGLAIRAGLIGAGVAAALASILSDDD
jgi:ribosome-binding protein aMBF1 (putative translation factor)